MKNNIDKNTMVSNNSPTRAVLNFSHKCVLNCEWCYVPFGAPKVKASVVEQIIEKITLLGFTSVTIGGGDPFQYKFIRELIVKAKKNGLFVHVDTHAKTLIQSPKLLSLIDDTVDLIGLPIDGASAYIHDTMRSTKGHFDLVIKCIEWLRPLRNRIKINTIISKKNIQTLPILSSLIDSISPMRWSVYQFMPMGPAGRVSQNHVINDSVFRESAKFIKNSFLYSNIVVEVNDRVSRRCTYPIIDHNGLVFVHSELPMNDFLNIGSIFELTFRITIKYFLNIHRNILKNLNQVSLNRHQLS